MFQESTKPFEELYFQQLEKLEDLHDLLDADLPIDVAASKQMVFDYLNAISGQNDIKVNDFFKDLPWINTSQPLSLAKDLNGMIVVADIFTYCCINCLHMLPYLSQIEEKYKSNEQVMVVGVHSPKFENEKSLKNVTNAVLRHNITHPVCNDAELKLWQHLSINCWPTVVIIGPDSRLLFFLVGEKSIRMRLEFYVDLCLEYFKEKLTGNKSSLPIKLLRDSTTSDLLYYPTKVSVSPSSSKIAIANTLKHSIVICDTSGIVQQIIGSNGIDTSGLADGTLEKALFNCPQGLAWQSDDVIFVCDTENHAIRKVDLKLGTVSTLAGNGEMGDDRKGGNVGAEQTLNSPWDCTFDSEHQRLYIAMAGSHQIWLLVLSPDGDFVHRVKYPYGTCVCFAGDGREQKRNNRFAHLSSFAQPTGVALGKEAKLYIADSESSSIRVVDLLTGSVNSLVGGGIDPTDLFVFGDADGTGTNCKLQHPMAVCANTVDDSIFIADTFNHKIRQVFVNSKHCQTLRTSWKVDIKEKLYLDEPNGICFFSANSKRQLLVVDTNNHRIVSIELSNGNVNNFKLYHFSQHNAQADESHRISSSSSTTDGAKVPVIEKLEDIVSVPIGETLLVKVQFNFIHDLKAELDAVHKVRISASDMEAIQITPSSMEISQEEEVKFEVSCKSEVHSEASIFIYCDLSLCNEKLNYCQLCRVCVRQPVQFTAATGDTGQSASPPSVFKSIEIDI